MRGAEAAAVGAMEPEAEAEERIPLLVSSKRALLGEGERPAAAGLLDSASDSEWAEVLESASVTGRLRDKGGWKESWQAC